MTTPVCGQRDNARIWNGKATDARRSIDRIRRVMHIYKGERSHRITGVASRRGKGADRAGDLRAGDVGIIGGAPARHRSQPALFLATALRRRRVVRGKCRRGAGTSVRVQVVAAPGARATTPARQEDAGERDSARGIGSGAAKKATVACALVQSGRYAMKAGGGRARCGTIQPSYGIVFGCPAPQRIGYTFCDVTFRIG